MNGDIRRSELDYLIHRLGKVFEIITGKSGNKIYVNILYTAFFCNLICLIEILNGMLSANLLQDLIVESLRINANTRNSVFLCGFKFLYDGKSR